MGGVLGVVLVFLTSITLFFVGESYSGSMAAFHAWHVRVVIGLLVADIAIAMLAYIGIAVWAPRAKSPNFIRIFVLTSAIIALGGITICSGVFSGGP